MFVHGTCLAVARGVAFLSRVYPTSPLPLLLSLVFYRPCGQALERQKEYFDCIRNERDELRDELADIKEKAKAGEVGPRSPRRKKQGYRNEFLALAFDWKPFNAIRPATASLCLFPPYFLCKRLIYT